MASLRLTEPGAHVLLRPVSPLGSVSLWDATAPPPERAWACPAAADHADAVTGARLRYDMPSGEGGRVVLRVALDGDALELPELDDALADWYATLSEDGRWLQLPGGRLVVAGGDEAIELAVPPGGYAVLWFSRLDCCPFMDAPAEALSAPDGPDDALAEQLLVLSPLEADEPPPRAELEATREVYRVWRALQQSTDVDEILALLEDPQLQLAAVHRLARLGQQAALESLVARGGLLSIAAGGLRSGAVAALGPASLDGLPED